MACTEPQCLYKGALYFTVELYLYSLYGPYGLYRASVPVQGCTLPLPYSRAIPLLPLWAVRPVQSLSACTRVTFNFTSRFRDLAWLRTVAVRVTLLQQPNLLYLTSEISKYSRKRPGFEFVLLSDIRLHSPTCLLCLHLLLLLALLQHFSGYSQIKSNIPTTRHAPRTSLMHFHHSLHRNSMYADS